MSSFRMSDLLLLMRGLKQRWLEVLDVSAAAVDAVSRARVLPAEESRVRIRRLANERAWLRTLDWSDREV
jgi:hypothetical protein